MNTATGNKESEVIGLLIGKVENDTLIINDSVTGDYSGEPHRVVLNPTTIAKIADDILNGRLKGNIVGWYHSHTAGGVFFSQTDVDTQKRFQQFSRLTLGMVVDAANGEVGFFRIDGDGNAVRISQDRLKIYEREVETPQPMPIPIVARKKPVKIVAIGLSLIALIIILSFAASSTNRPSTSVPTIITTTNPTLTTIAGSPIPITVNATGAIDMTLYYAVDGRPFTQAPMATVGPGGFQYIIPGSQVSSNLTYYMEGTFGSAKVASRPYQVRVSDFTLQLRNNIVVYRNSTKPSMAQLNLISINGFSDQVTLLTNGLPNNVIASPPSTRTVPSSELNLSLYANPNAVLQTFPLTISASYPLSNSQTLTRSAIIMVTVTDFNIQVIPSTVTADPTGQATLVMNLTLSQGFNAPIRLSFNGLPEDSKIQLAPSTNNILLTGNSSTTYNLQVTATKQGTYNVVLTCIATLPNGDSISHSQTIQLIVR